MFIVVDMHPLAEVNWLPFVVILRIVSGKIGTLDPALGKDAGLK